jgi:hypothetical protein
LNEAAKARNSLSRGIIDRSKNRIPLDNYYLLGQLEQSIAEFVAYYNNRRYYESLDNLTPAEVLLRQRTGHYQKEGNHRTPTSPASAGKRRSVQLP